MLFGHRTATDRTIGGIVPERAGRPKGLFIDRAADGAAVRALQIGLTLFYRKNRDEEQAEVKILPESVGLGQAAGGAP